MEQVAGEPFRKERGGTRSIALKLFLAILLTAASLAAS
jgi:hypothetical protein